MTSFVKHNTVADQVLYTVPFPYINRTHVKPYRNGIGMLNPSDYEWESASTIRTREVLPEGTLVEIRRETPADALVKFQNGSVLTEDDLNTAALQSLFRTEEQQDQLNGYVSDAITHFGINGEDTIVNTDELYAAVAAGILQSSLLADLQQRIGDIDTNAQTILDQEIRVNALESIVNDLADVDGTGIGTFVLNEQEARIDGDEALQNSLDLLGAKSGDGLSWLLNLDTVQVSPTESLSDRLTWLQSSVSGNTAAITAEQSARAAADAALASSVSTLSTTVGANTAALSTIQTVVNGPSGLAAQYMVKTDVNGYVSGFGLYNSAGSSEFIVLADHFAVVSPSQASKKPFVVSTVNGVTSVGINGGLIVDGTLATNALAANSVTAGKLNVSSLSAITATIGTLRTAASGARLEISDNIIKVYDASGVVRVKLGNLDL